MCKTEYPHTVLHGCMAHGNRNIALAGCIFILLVAW